MHPEHPLPKPEHLNAWLTKLLPRLVNELTWSCSAADILGDLGYSPADYDYLENPNLDGSATWPTLDYYPDEDERTGGDLVVTLPWSQEPHRYQVDVAAQSVTVAGEPAIVPFCIAPEATW